MWLRNIALALGSLGCLLFSTVFVLSYAQPSFVENVGKNIIRQQVEKKVNQKIEALDTHFLSQAAAKIIKTKESEIATIQRQIKAGLPDKIAAVIANMRELDCECRKKAAASVRNGFFARLTSATHIQAQLTHLIETKYIEVSTALLREFRIFTGSNAFVFACLALVVVFKKHATLHLLPVAIVLVTSSGITAYFYIFKQNWLHSLIFNDYVGMAYLGYLMFVFLLLCDLIFNRARVTVNVLQSCANISVTPC